MPTFSLGLTTFDLGNSIVLYCTVSQDVSFGCMYIVPLSSKRRLCYSRHSPLEPNRRTEITERGHEPWSNISQKKG